MSAHRGPIEVVNIGLERPTSAASMRCKHRANRSLLNEAISTCDGSFDYLLFKLLKVLSAKSYQRAKSMEGQLFHGEKRQFNTTF